MRRRLLIVEDDPTLRQALTFNLTREGYEVTSAADGEAALEAARSDRLDLVLLDVMLPGMSGVEVLRVLRREGITTPVIILSAKGDEIEVKGSTVLRVDLTPDRPMPDLRLRRGGNRRPRSDACAADALMLSSDSCSARASVFQVKPRRAHA